MVHLINAKWFQECGLTMLLSLAGAVSIATGMSPPMIWANEAKANPCRASVGDGGEVLATSGDGMIELQFKNKGKASLYGVRGLGTGFECLKVARVKDQIYSLLVDRGIAGTSTLVHQKSLLLFKLDSGTWRELLDITTFREIYRSERWQKTEDRSYKISLLPDGKLAVELTSNLTAEVVREVVGTSKRDPGQATDVE